MTDTYSPTPEAEVNNLCLDAYVAAITARSGKLNIKAADQLVGRLREHAARMIFPDDAELLREAAGRFETAATRVKAGGLRPRAKAAPQPSIADMIRAWDAEQMSGGSPSSRDPDIEAARVAEMNRQLAERNRSIEEQRRG
jgi:hypothetical protein